ncbi:MAG: phosphate ABC transporter substrate-binding protein PstS family protein [Anaerolineales bacterium]|jgi:phosphate transport system substrate-binding protein|nr:phosphate ABC transporter substrate-binding protein PstS family protein [Anaerolineales bacterium]
MKIKLNTLFVVVMALALVLSACSTATQAPAAEPTTAPAVEPTAAPVEEPAPVEAGVMLPEVDPAAYSGEFVAAGSSTVYPLAEVIADRFADEGFAGKVTINSIGSGAGFERFCVEGDTDIANASRAIKSSEVENCAAIGRTPIEFLVGIDALAVVVSTENDFLTDVTLEELGKIYSSSTVKWSDVRPEWPNEDILRFSPGTDSGTFDFFVEVAMGPLHKNAEGKADLDAAEKDILDASGIQLSEDDNVLVQGVEGSKYAIGYFGFAYYNENQGNLKAISVNGVAPSAETAENGEYPLARPLFIYSDATIIAQKPQVGAFINFFLTYVNEEIGAVGYFPASQEKLDAARQALLDVLK